MPVKDPGPQPTATASILLIVKEADFNKEEKVLSLFDTREYNRPGYTNYKKCPHCSSEGNTNEEVRELFGFIHSGNHTYIQSWCKDCRKEKVSKKEGRDEHSLFEEK